jgi:hypothetical protein
VGSLVRLRVVGVRVGQDVVGATVGVEARVGLRVVGARIGAEGERLSRHFRGRLGECTRRSCSRRHGWLSRQRF